MNFWGGVGIEMSEVANLDTKCKKETMNFKNFKNATFGKSYFPNLSSKNFANLQKHVRSM